MLVLVATVAFAMTVVVVLPPVGWALCLGIAIGFAIGYDVGEEKMLARLDEE